MAYTTTPAHAQATIAKIVDDLVKKAGLEAESRAYRVANELTNATSKVLSGARSGRRYAVPGTGRVSYNKKNHTAKITYKYYTASAPGEPPAVRTGAFRMSWKRRTYIDGRSGNDRVIHGVAESDLRAANGALLGSMLENGTGKMAPRPYKKRVIEEATPKVQAIMRAPYLGG